MSTRCVEVGEVGEVAEEKWRRDGPGKILREAIVLRSD